MAVTRNWGKTVGDAGHEQGAAGGRKQGQGLPVNGDDTHAHTHTHTQKVYVHATKDQDGKINYTGESDSQLTKVN